MLDISVWHVRSGNANVSAKSSLRAAVYSWRGWQMMAGVALCKDRTGSHHDRCGENWTAYVCESISRARQEGSEREVG